jgi:NadR type nicotinamide-nucleotide adenylyltransferase
MTLPPHGLVVGRFLPPHAGHHALVEAARRRCRRLTVAAVACGGEGFPLAARLAALAETHPGVRIVGAETAEPFAPGAPGEELVARLGALAAEPVDALFTGSSTGGELAGRLGATHVVVPREPALAALASREVRRDPAACWPLLVPATRGELVRRVVVTGSESTGKTTLAARLAARYGTVWVPEFGRELTVVKQQRTVPPEPWQPADFSWIAAEQERRTNEAARRSGPLVFADTDAIATQVWEERYLERASHATERIAAASRADLYLLALADVPWVADGLRDGDAALRGWMTDRIRDLVAPRGVPVVELAGGWEERERTAVAACDALLARGWEFSAAAR